MGAILVAAAASAPVDLEDVKRYCKIETDADNATVEMFIAAASAQVQTFLNKSIVEQTWKITFPAFADAMAIEPGPVTGITSVKYLDADRIQRTLDASVYIEDLISSPARIVRDPDESWPVTADAAVPNVIEIEFKTGPEVADPEVALAICALVAQWNDNRIPGPMPKGVEQLLAPLRRIIL